MLEIPGKIPIRIQPAFWILAFWIAYVNSSSLAAGIIWVFVVIFSVLVHELGHASLAILFHQHPRIELVVTGGLTSYEGRNLKIWQRFLIVLHGPLFGFALYFLASGVLALHIFSQPMVLYFFYILKRVNLVWSFLNLVPVYPLDGGQLLRMALERFFAERGLKLSFLIGMTFSILAGLFFIVNQGFIIGALFFLFGYQSYEMWRDSRFISSSDRKESYGKKLEEGERLLEQGRVEDAKSVFSFLRSVTRKGIVFGRATHHLASLAFQEGDISLAYQLLRPIENQLSGESLCLLHEVAFLSLDYPLVVKLSSLCYQSHATPDVALRNAKAFAFLGKGHLSGGWLAAAVGKGKLNLEEILSDRVFDNVRQDVKFMSFFHER
ncbi:MAG: site-2 protease family protein [Chlamydiota bacterium]